MTSQGMLIQPKEFENIIVRTGHEGDAAIVRVGDVGTAELGSQNYSMTSKMNGNTAAHLVVYQQPGANAIETSKRVRALLEELSPGFPDDFEYRVVIDTSQFTEASIEKVVHTFFEAVVLVVAVVFLFLQSFRATIIPTIAVPIAIIGTYVGIYALGFSTNMLTLFGMILAIGLVVDDAIIVVEAVEHKMATKGHGAEGSGQGSNARTDRCAGVHRARVVLRVPAGSLPWRYDRNAVQAVCGDHRDFDGDFRDRCIDACRRHLLRWS